MFSQVYLRYHWLLLKIQEINRKVEDLQNCQSQNVAFIFQVCNFFVCLVFNAEWHFCPTEAVSGLGLSIWNKVEKHIAKSPREKRSALWELQM